jgi:hypothetical protein
MNRRKQSLRYFQSLLALKLFSRRAARVSQLRAQRLLNLQRHHARVTMFEDTKYAEEYIQGVLSGRPENLHCLTTLTKEQLISLDEWLTTHGSLISSKTTSTMLKVFIFLFICGKGASLRDTRSYFRRYISIISDAFHDVLDAMQLLYAAYVRLPDGPQPPHSRVANNPKMFAFKDCIGAIDSTYIYANIKGADRSRTGAEVWRNRKGFSSQNVLAIAGFSMNFLMIHDGWEGSAHDATVLKDAQAKGPISLLPDKYLVADAGYSEKTGYGGLVLSPYMAVRYHLKEWAHAKDRLQKKEELFNLRHAQLRGVVERIFGAFKNRFHIFDKPRDGYSLETQVAIVTPWLGYTTLSIVSRMLTFERSGRL